MKTGTAVLVGMILMMSVNALSQDQSNSTKTPVVKQRQINQQKRIGNGVKSGQLTPQETRKLEREQAKIQHDKHAAKADGKVTPAERARLQREQNKASHDIHRLKHNNRKTDAAK